MSDTQSDVWLSAAACGDPNINPEIFYMRQNGNGEAGNSAAKKICRRCQVRNECLKSALRLGERYGVWGGYAAWERRELSEGS
ncbi:WhiB family transcriptional regulator [Streptomyces sp. NPDC059688]|uniref:WhiB family transcriptional regulator n=1 Tax=Streptomyces sp. NPDC059688 TaxID=3346906 RepID=UPI0036BED3E0